MRFILSLIPFYPSSMHKISHFALLTRYFSCSILLPERIDGRKKRRGKSHDLKNEKETRKSKCESLLLPVHGITLKSLSSSRRQPGPTFWKTAVSSYTVRVMSCWRWMRSRRLFEGYNSLPAFVNNEIIPRSNRLS